ncbi:PLD nuclease N-terminal domain-containing protein [Natrialbaceae archaeon AArc-T1-2]|uniref:PLD nuclease N-terminal domain-containing protein n=1 Tax=Natrialbaceae archaeon AArc-T1-2 TaxID=3053904 RepID=UPI0031F30BB0
MSNALLLLLVGIPLVWHAALTGFTYYDSEKVGLSQTKWTAIVLLVPIFGFFLYLLTRSELDYDPETDPYAGGNYNIHESRRDDDE